MSVIKEVIKDACISHLLTRCSENEYIKVNCTINEYERFQEWIKNLDFETLTDIVIKEDFRSVCHEKCDQLEGNERHICRLSCDIMIKKQQLSKIIAEKTNCVQTQDPEKCIAQIDYRITAAKEELTQLILDLNELKSASHKR